jgi:hypothetical protein
MAILEEWTGYIDDIDEEKVYMVLFSETNPDNGEEYGESPIEHFAHFGDNLKRGVHITMKVSDDPRDVIFNWVTPTAEQIEAGRRQVEELLAMIAVFKDDP